MPRPSPLEAPSSYPRYDTQLTPRTPHSRAGRAEEAYNGVEMEEIDFDNDDDYGSVVQQQNAPLLSSSASNSFPEIGYRSRGDEYEERTTMEKGGLTAEKIISRLPLALYSSVAAILLVLVFFSLREPDTLKKYVGATGGSGVVSAGNPAATAAPGHMAEGVTLISYANYTNFPLDPIEYRGECIKLNTGPMAPHRYWAEHTPRDVPHVDEQPGYTPSGPAPICKRTITYQLDGWAGLMVDLALIAQAAALARERDATFFIMDQFWNRGKWNDHFEDVRLGQPGPEPGCVPPPPEEYVACPRTARHWILNSRTSRYHFGHGFNEEFQDPFGHNLNRLKPLFNFAWLSFDSVIRPNAQTLGLIRWAREELQEKLAAHYKNSRSTQGVQHDDSSEIGYLGVHIRRGDRAPEWRVYGRQYIPVSDYVSSAVESWTRLGLDISANNKQVQPFVYVASDSPEVVKNFSTLFSEDRVFSLSRSKRPELQVLESPEEYFQDIFMTFPDAMRIPATRGMIVDFALLSGAWANDGDLIPDGTVCAVSSVVCKLSAVALGWKRSFGVVDKMGEIEQEARRWMDVDLKGRVVPVWEPVQLY